MSNNVFTQRVTNYKSEYVDPIMIGETGRQRISVEVVWYIDGVEFARRSQSWNPDYGNGNLPWKLEVEEVVEGAARDEMVAHWAEVRRTLDDQAAVWYKGLPESEQETVLAKVGAIPGTNGNPIWFRELLRRAHREAQAEACAVPPLPMELQMTVVPITKKLTTTYVVQCPTPDCTTEHDYTREVEEFVDIEESCRQAGTSLPVFRTLDSMTCWQCHCKSAECQLRRDACGNFQLNVEWASIEKGRTGYNELPVTDDTNEIVGNGSPSLWRYKPDEDKDVGEIEFSTYTAFVQVKRITLAKGSPAELRVSVIEHLCADRRSFAQRTIIGEQYKDGRVAWKPNEYVVAQGAYRKKLIEVYMSILAIHKTLDIHGGAY